MPTVDTFLTEIRDALDEPQAAQFSDDMLVRWLNEAGRDLARATRYLKATTTVNLIAEQDDYLLPEDVVAVEHVYYHDASGQTYPVHPEHMEVLEARYARWSHLSSFRPSAYSVIGHAPDAVLRFVPPPNTTDTATVVYARIPTELTIPIAPTAEVEAPAVWRDALVHYVEWRALRRDRDQRWTEARDLYMEARDGLIHNPDLLAVNREVIASPRGYLPRWLVEGGDW